MILYLAVGVAISIAFSLFRDDDLTDFIKRLLFTTSLNVVFWYLFFN